MSSNDKVMTFNIKIIMEVYSKMINFAKAIKQLREGKGLTQESFAKELGITTRQLQRYESGEQLPSLVKLVEIADQFNVSTDFLLGRNG